MEAGTHIRELTDSIRVEALRLGFLECGFSEVRDLEELKPVYSSWLDKGYHATMGYMERNVDKRLNPALLVENSKSVISLLYNYYTPGQFQKAPYKISRYAYGNDYHDVIRDKLNQLGSFIRQIAGEVEQRGFVDSAPVMERHWAQQSGLGWIGKNTCLISRKHGSFMFIAEIITSLQLRYDEPINDYCGNCTKCVDACPTSAITPFRLIDSNKCISYQTIENKGEISPLLTGKFENYIFGCDICQEVCPWNKKSVAHNEPLFALKPQIAKMSKESWDNLDEDQFRIIFKNSPVKRTKYAGLMRNIAFSESKI